MSREFNYSLPTGGLSAYRLVLACGDAILAMPDDPLVPEIGKAREALQAIVDDPAAYGIDKPWYALAGIVEGPIYAPGDAQYDAVNKQILFAKYARSKSNLPTPQGSNAVQIGLSKATDDITKELGDTWNTLKPILTVIILILVLGGIVYLVHAAKEA